MNVVTRFVIITACAACGCAQQDAPSQAETNPSATELETAKSETTADSHAASEDEETITAAKAISVEPNAKEIPETPEPDSDTGEEPKQGTSSTNEDEATLVPEGKKE